MLRLEDEVRAKFQVRVVRAAELRSGTEVRSVEVLYREVEDRQEKEVKAQVVKMPVGDAISSYSPMW